MTDTASPKAKRTAAHTAWERAAGSGILSVAVAAPVAGFYDYLAGSVGELPRGSLVEVPFGGRHLPGIVMGPALGDVAPAKLRPISRGVDLPVLGSPNIPTLSVLILLFDNYIFFNKFFYEFFCCFFLCYLQALSIS